VTLARKEMVRGFAQGAGAGGRVRLRTLSNLRWLAVAGQSAALFLVYFALGYPLPILYCAIAIAVSAGLNVVLAVRYAPAHRLTNREATFYLAFDVLQLAALLYLTGGIANPFALMFLGPVVIAATLGIAGAIMAEAALSFLGLGIQPPTASWGSMIGEGRESLEVAPRLAFMPAIAMFLTVLSFNLVGDTLRALTDPRQGAL